MGIKKWNLGKTLPYILIICGVIGVICSFILTQDKIRLLQNPNAHLGCSLNPIISCGSVIESNQGHAFGFPNPYLGLAGFSAMITIGIVLIAGAKLKKWFWIMLQAGLTSAVLFVLWLIFQSLFRINALCIYCMVTWVITFTSFWYITLYNIDQKTIKIRPERAQTAHAWIRKHHLDILILWFLIIAGLVLKHFWYYYGPRIT